MPDIRLHIDDSGGDGRPVVLIHGWPLSAESWDDQTDALVAAGYRVVAYDRRGFGRSDKPDDGYDYDTLAADLDQVLTDLDLQDVTLVGFSMGGGEVARYIAAYGQDRLRSVVLAAATPPYLLQSDDNPDGPLTDDARLEMRAGLEADRDSFFDEFTTGFFSTADGLQVTEEQRQQAIALAQQSSQAAALAAMDAWATTDFRDDLGAISVPTLVIHGDGDQTVPFEGSGRRTHAAIDGSELHVVEGAPHGMNVSHAEEFNRALLDFLAR
ncbi:alpha/beta fold hydrolase [Agrococcus sp. DT81.2]|uniref:alpha/beta fold hydrolase n=1 Tax=Agrococcus sp. DT81.2 TaxID=3393414 RepID=UPI003CE577DE